jgi:hypothetical protein
MLKAATLLRSRGVTDAISMSPRQIVWMTACMQEDHRREIQQIAVGTAVGMSGDRKAWNTIGIE